jgi:menaquinone-dependent protoporphyrinogen oxidase
VTSEPREFATFRDSLHPREERVFFGAFDPAARPIGMAESVMHHLPATARKAMPAGDYRDWAVIEAWADSIAEGLTSVQLA